MDTREKTETNVFEHKCWECGRVYFDNHNDEIDNPCADCVISGKDGSN